MRSHGRAVGSPSDTPSFETRSYPGAGTLAGRVELRIDGIEIGAVMASPYVERRMANLDYVHVAAGHWRLAIGRGRFQHGDERKRGDDDKPLRPHFLTSARRGHEFGDPR